MDRELLMALLVLWCGSTMAMVIFLHMWFSNDGAAFHPHSVDVENRHPAFLVVNSKTVCKRDCAIKSVSAFVAPRGSSSSKHFTALCMMISIAGMLGSARWYFVRDATWFQFTLSSIGFGALMLVAGFELDVAPERFLEDKQMITAWLIEKLKMDKMLPFKLSPQNKEFRHFIRSSPEIYHLYEEDRYLHARKAENIEMWTYELVWQSLHVIGAVSYVTLVPAAILLNDMAEEKVAWITGFTFLTFCMMGYFTGNYVPVLPYFRGWILVWNPFLREPHFMLKLKRAIETYVENHKNETNGHSSPLPSPRASSPRGASSSNGKHATEGTLTRRNTRSRANSSSTKRKHSDAEDGELEEPYLTKPPARRGSGKLVATTPGKSGKNGNGKKNGSSDKTNGIASSATGMRRTDSQRSQSTGHSSDEEEEDKVNSTYKKLRAEASEADEAAAAEADKCLDSAWLRYARNHPTDYLYIVSYVMVMSELISMMTPCVAMGIQWITALCDGPPVLAIIELGWESMVCLYHGGIHCTFNTEQLQHCILRA